jgi:ferric-dicitrate binding protein FerR (iron transport regulator)
MAYEDEEATRTTLVSGSIRVIRGDRQVLPQPGGMVVIKEDRMDIRDADIEQVLAWKNGMLSLENADLASVLRQISRWYNVDIHYQAGVPDKHFFGLVSRSVSLSTILEYLRENNVHIEQQGEDITVLP